MHFLGFLQRKSVRTVAGCNVTRRIFWGVEGWRGFFIQEKYLELDIGKVFPPPYSPDPIFKHMVELCISADMSGSIDQAYLQKRRKEEAL